MEGKAEELAKYEIQSICIELGFWLGTYIHDFQKYSPTFREQVVEFLGGVSKALVKFFEEANESNRKQKSS